MNYFQYHSPLTDTELDTIKEQVDIIETFKLYKNSRISILDFNSEASWHTISVLFPTPEKVLILSEPHESFKPEPTGELCWVKVTTEHDSAIELWCKQFQIETWN